MSTLSEPYLENPEQEKIRRQRATLSRFLGEAARLVLEAYDAIEGVLGHMVGQHKLMEFLGGVDSAHIRQHGLNELTHYGVFSSVSKDWLHRLIDNLKASGYLTTHGTYRPVLVLSEEAEAAVRHSGELPLLPGEILQDPVLSSLAPCNEREAMLRIFRYRLGRLFQRPSREVMKDILLRDWALNPPASKEAMAEQLSARTAPHAEAIWDILTGNSGEDVKQEA